MEPGWTLHVPGTTRAFPPTQARNSDGESMSPFEAARQILELTQHQADRLFHMCPYMYVDIGPTLKEEAAEACRSLATTGVVIWPSRKAA